jgi:hypothetical protein
VTLSSYSSFLISVFVFYMLQIPSRGSQIYYGCSAPTCTPLESNSTCWQHETTKQRHLGDLLGCITITSDTGSHTADDIATRSDRNYTHNQAGYHPHLFAACQDQSDACAKVSSLALTTNETFLIQYLRIYHPTKPLTTTCIRNSIINDQSVMGEQKLAC